MFGRLAFGWWAKGFQSKYNSLVTAAVADKLLSFEDYSLDVATLINISIFLHGKPISILPIRLRNVAAAAESREILSYPPVPPPLFPPAGPARSTAISSLPGEEGGDRSL